MKDKYPAQSVQDVLMTMNCVSLYNAWEVMAGQWGYYEPVIAKRVKAVATKIQTLRYQKNNFDCIQENKIYRDSGVLAQTQC